MKQHNLIDLRGPTPWLVIIGDGTTHEVNIPDQLFPVPSAHYDKDRDYVNFRFQARAIKKT